MRMSVALWAVLLVAATLTEAKTCKDDAEVLLEWKASWTTVPKIIAKGAKAWRAGTDPCTQKWFGITTKKGRVMSIDLDEVEAADLVGTFTPGLAALDALEDLDIEGIKGLTGPIPNSFSNLVNLEDLDLESLGLSGIPPSFARTKLTEFSLDGNKFVGPLPADLPSTLTKMELESNDFEGRLPGNWAVLPNLKAPEQVQVFNNTRLFGGIPSSWTEPSSAFVQKDIILLLKPNTGLCGPVPNSLRGKVGEWLGPRNLNNEDEWQLYNPINNLGLCVCPPVGHSCTSDFISLPKVSHQGQEYFLGYSRGTARKVANAHCKQAGTYAKSGTIRHRSLPPQFRGQEGQWRTFNPATGETCVGAKCMAIAVMECVKPGHAPLKRDAKGNIGCDNLGTNSVGSWNDGSNVMGSCNLGSNNVGDSSSGSNVVGHRNTRSNLFGSNDQPA